MHGLVLITDFSCKEFRFGVLPPNSKRQYIFLKKEILLKMIIAVYCFGICSSVKCRAKILIRLHLGQADLVDCTVRLCMSLFQEKRPYGISDQHRQDQHAHPHSVYFGAV